MKKLLLSIALLLPAYSFCQTWLQQVNPNNPQKLQDIINAYENNKVVPEQENNSNEPVEDDNFQFDRWKWYWQSHTDDQGYLVSPLKTWNEWAKYMQSMGQQSKLARTTGVSEANWTFQGPDTSAGHGYGIGRITRISFHPTDSNTYWVSTGGGGAWKTNDAGRTWTAINDNFPVLGISDVVFNPQNPNTIYLCTGDRDANYTYSAGVLKSTDGGNTWDPTGLSWKENLLKLANALIINPKDTNTLLLAANDGIHQSFDGGKTWSITKAGNFVEVLYNPADTNIVYAATQSASSLLGTYYAQIYRSADGGATWTAVTNFTRASRASLAIAPAYPGMVKALVSNSNDALMGIYSSWDSGKTFTPVFTDTDCSRNILNSSPNLSASTCDGQAWYDLCIAIDPRDTNKIYVGGVNTWYSTDAGHTWNVLTQWSNFIHGLTVVHADKHFLGFSPLQPGRLFETNDGGVYYSDNPTVSWNDITNGMGITQFYRIAVSNGASFVLGGAQDNGCKMINGTAYTELTGGDGMQVQIDYSNPSTIYTASQYGSINKSTNGGASFRNISRNISGTPQGAWITPYVIYPGQPNTLLAGYDRIYLTTDGGDSWNSVAAPIATGVNIDRIRIAPSNPSYVYLLEGNEIYLSTDFNVTSGTATFNKLSVPISGTIADIAVDPKDETHIWVTFSGYGTAKVGDYKPSRSPVWINEGGTLPNIPYHCIAIDSINGTLYLGADVAVFYRDSTMSDWALYNKGLPNAQVYDLQINYTTNQIYAGTFGRGIWMSAKHTPGMPSALSIVPFASNVFTVAPNPSNGSFMVTTSNTSFYGQLLQISLVNADGVIVWKKQMQMSTDGRLNINANVARGIYILQAEGESGMAKAKVVIY